MPRGDSEMRADIERQQESNEKIVTVLGHGTMKVTIMIYIMIHYAGRHSGCGRERNSWVRGGWRGCGSCGCGCG